MQATSVAGEGSMMCPPVCGEGVCVCNRVSVCVCVCVLAVHLVYANTGNS